MKTLVLLLALTLPGVAFAQQGRRHEGKPQQMRQEERQRMRDDMNQVYRERGQRQERPARSPQEREKLRKDVQDANRQLKR
jgi:hypothetical protein